MTTVPPPNVALPQVLAAAAAPTTIVIPQPPPALAAVPVGTVIEVVVLPPPPAATPATPAPLPAAPVVVLHTAVGDLTARLPIPLPEKVHVDLEVVRSTPQQVTVRIATVDGTPALQYLAQARIPTGAAAPVVPSVLQPTKMPLLGPQPLPPGMMWMPSGPAPFVQTGLISAVVTQAPPPVDAALVPTPPAPTAPPAPTGAVPTSAPAASPPVPGQAAPSPFAALQLGPQSELALKIVSVQLPGAPVITAPNMAAPLAPAAAVGTPAVSTAVLPAPPLAANPPPTIVLAGVPNAPSPPSPPAMVQPAPTLATATGVVIANVDNILVIEIDDRQVQLNVRANLPVGSKIVFDVTAAAPPRANAPLPLPAAAPPLSGPSAAHTGWPTLSEAVSVLQRSDPPAAQQLAQAIPDGGPRTAAAAIAFVQAMRSGDTRQWPGDSALRALERAGPRGAHLASTLSGEVAELAARARDTGAEWRALPIPWSADGQIDRIALITRREGEDDAGGAAGRKGGGTRFLIDLDLSRFGPMQLDGMFKKDLRAFDLVLRTKTALPEDMRRDLVGIFTNANGAMGLTGGLTFQVTKKFADPLGGTNAPDKSGLWA